MAEKRGMDNGTFASNGTYFKSQSNPIWMKASELFEEWLAMEPTFLIIYMKEIYYTNQYTMQAVYLL